MSAFGTKRTCPFALHMSANDPKRTLRSARRARCTASAFGGSLSELGKVRYATVTSLQEKAHPQETQAWPLRRSGRLIQIPEKLLQLPNRLIAVGRSIEEPDPLTALAKK